MSKLEEFYRALIKDPDLEIKAGQTREQAAQQEAEYRARQYHNNEQALSMATEPEKSALDSLFDFMAKEYRGVSDEGIKALHENLPNKFGPLKYEQIVDRVQTGKNKGEPKLKPDVKPDKQYRYNDKTGKLELFQPRAQAGTSNSPSDWKYKDSDTPSAESIKDFVDGLYGNLQDRGLSEEDVLSYIEQNINNPDWYNSKTEDGVSQKEVIEDYIKRLGVAREKQRLQTSNIPERDNPPSARARALDKIKEAETGVTEEQPSNEKAREIQADTDNYNRIKDSLGNKNRKGTRAVWTTPRSSEKKIFDALPKEIQTVLNDIHSKGKGATRLTPAQQIHLLNKFNEENETSTHTDLYEGMRTDDDKGYNFRHDPSINPESYRDRLNQNKLKFNEDIKQDAMTAVNRFLQSDKNDLDLTDNQIKVLQDSVLEDNLNTILAPVVEAKAQNIKAPLKNPSDEVEKPENPPSRAKFTKAAEKYFNRKGDELKDIIQTMENSGLFDSTIPAKGGTKIRGFKQETSENLIAMFENDTNPQFREVRDRLPQILDMTKKRRDPNGKVTTYKLSDLATKIDNEKAIEDSNNENLTQSDEEFEENIVENQKDNTDTSNEVQETIDTVSDKPDNETVNTGSAYSGPAFGEGIPEEEEAGDTTGRLEILPHDMDHSEDKSALTEINKRKQDLLKKLDKGWASFSKRDKSGEWDIFPEAVNGFGEAEQNIFEKYYGIDINAGNIPDSTDVTERTSIPKTNSELDQFSLEEIGTLAGMLVENNDDIRDKTDAEDIKDVMAWGGKNKSKYEQDIRDEINSQNFKDAVSLDNLNREEAEARRQERQNLIDAGQATLDDASTTSSDDDSSEGGDGEEETVVEEPAAEKPVAEEVTPESDAEKIESLNLIRDGKNFREMDENGNPDKSKPIVREIEINGEKKYIASIKDGSDTIWYEHTEENKNSSQKGDENSTGNTRKDLVAKLQEQADSKAAGTAAETEAPAEAEASAEAGEGDTTVETETEAGEGDTTVETETETEETSADGGSNETSTDTTESSTDEQVEGAGEVSAEGSGGEQVDGDTQGDAEGSGEDTPTIPPAIKSQLDKAEKKKLIRHAYEKELGLNKGEEDDFHKYEAYKKEFIEEYSDKPIEKLNKKLGQIGKSIRQIEAKAADAAKKADDKEKKDNLKIKQQEEKERLDRIRDEKNADEERENNIAYGETEEAQQARDEAHATSGANLFTHFNDKGEVSHETHGEAIGDDSKHNHFDEHDKKESGSHPAHHHNKEILDKNIPPALREIKEEEGKEEPNEQIISKNRQFLQQKNQEGYVWNHNTNHWIHRENLSGLMAGHVGNNATLANGNHVGKSGKATFLDGSGNAAQGIFHLGSGYNVHKFGMGITGKHLANAYNQGGQLKNHIKSGNLATKFNNSKGIYESSGIGAPKATAKSGADLRSLGRQGAESGFNVTPMVSSIRSFFGLKKGELSNSALQQLVESYSGKNKKR